MKSILPGFRATVSPEIRHQVSRVADRLHSELRVLLSSLQRTAQSPSSLSQAIGVERTSCHRVVAATRSQRADPRILLQLPGVQGLRKVLAGISSTYPELDGVGASAAIDSLEELLTTLGGGRRHLEALLKAPEESGDRDNSTARYRLFESASEVLGKHADVLNSIRIYAPLPADPRRFIRVSLAGWTGLSAQRDAMPTSWVSGGSFSEPDQLKRANVEGKVLLSAFSSDPLPRIVAKEVENGQVAQVVDFEENFGQPIDLFLVNKTIDPELDPSAPATKLGACWSLIDVPTREIVTDFYLHQDIEREYRPWVDSQLWGPQPTPPSADGGWLKRLPDVPDLELLGRGTSRTDFAPYSKQRALTEHLFELLGWDPMDFFGFRSSQSYPVWRSGLCMVFEEARVGTPEASAGADETTDEDYEPEWGEVEPTP